jgi:hypothetical protein
MMAAVVSFALFTLGGSARAEGDCREVKAQQVGVFDGVTNTTTGRITNGGRLSGTYLTAFGVGSLPTQDPTTVTFTGDYTITTRHGQLKVFNVYLYNFAGLASVLGRINPTTSTGRFAGATGVLYFAGKVTNFNPYTVEEELTGEICYPE